MAAVSLKVISASRRLEMVGFFPQKIVDFLERRCPPERVHTIVLWSKSPGNLLSHDVLRNKLKTYDQVFLHLTITGMGNSVVEPGIPSLRESLYLLPEIVKWSGDPKLCRIRFDPVVHFRFDDGREYSNLRHFTTVAKMAAGVGIEEIITSWMTVYPKVRKRLNGFGITPFDVTKNQRKKESEWLFCEAANAGVRLSGCCATEFPSSACINGALLTRCHPEKLPASVKKAGGQRSGCGCTESWDIGWYVTCPGGCLYCYGRPELNADRYGKGFPE